MVFEGGFELFYEVFEGAHGDSCSGNGLLFEGGGPGLGRSLGHVGEGESNLFGTGVVDCVIDFLVEKNQRKPWDGFQIGSVIVFQHSNAKFIDFGGHGRRRGKGYLVW